MTNDVDLWERFWIDYGAKRTEFWKIEGADWEAGKIYRKGATSFFSNGEWHSLTKILRRSYSGEDVKQFLRQLDQTATF